MTSSTAPAGDPGARHRGRGGPGPCARTAGHARVPAAPAAPGPADQAPATAARGAPGRALAGRTVLLPRLREPDALARALEQAGARVMRAALTRTSSTPEQQRSLARMGRDLVAGRAAWLVLTSARTVEALAPHLERAGREQPDRGGLPGPATGAGATTGGGAVMTTRVAVVGPATARAWQEATGRPPDLVARGSAAALLEAPELAEAPGPAGAAPAQCEPGVRDATVLHSPSLPRTRIPPPGMGRRLLLPASALADPALAEGLRAAGWQVEQLRAYTTLTADPGQVPAQVRQAWSGGGVGAVVLTAPSTARAVLELLGPPPSPARVVAIGATTARATTELGLEVAAVAGAPTPLGVREAVERALLDGTDPPPHHGDGSAAARTGPGSTPA